MAINFRRALALTVSVTVAAGCGSAADTISPPPPPPPPPSPTVAAVTLSGTVGSLIVGHTVQLGAAANDAAGNLVTATISWSSSNAAVASVSSSGLVTAVAVGSATITAASSGHDASTTIAVTPITALPVATVTLSGTVASVVVGATVQLGATARDATGNVVATTITWSSSNGAVATVSSTGLVTAVAVGSVVITAASDGHAATTTMAVVPVAAAPVAAVTISAPALGLAPGVTTQFSATLKDAQGTVLAGRAVTWATSQSTVASISASGLVTAIAAGTTNITATSEGITSAAMTVTVTTGATLIEQRALAQQGLTIAFASTTLQSQIFTLLDVAGQSDDETCYPLPAGGSFRLASSARVIPVTVNFYFDTACARIFIAETVTAFTADNLLGNFHVTAAAVYTGPTGTPLGTTTLDEAVTGYGLVPGHISGIVTGLGTFTPASGAPSVRLGLDCNLGVQGAALGICQGGVAQNFSNLSAAFGSVTTLALDTTATGTLSINGTAELTTGAVSSLTLVEPTSTSMVINGGTHYSTTVTTGGAATFSLFPPTPTGWTVTDAANDQLFTITVIDDISRSLTGTIKRISTGVTLATLALDQSGSGVITYSDHSTGAVASWTLGQ